MVFLIALGSLLILLIAVVAIAWPLVQEEGSDAEVMAAEMGATVAVDPLAELQEQRASLYGAIKELEFDFQVGKMSEADYQIFDTQLKGRAVAVLKEMDALKEAEVDPALDQRLEAEIAALRRNGTTRASAAQFCPQCGKRLRAGDRFCGSCGATVA